MYDPSAGAAPSTSPGARYAYLVGRLRNRQITMEEATELFGLMQGMLQRSEAARLAAVAGASAPPSPPRPASPPPAGTPTPSTALSDDTLLIGLLALGAGVGVLTALQKRTREGPGSKPTAGRASPPSSSSS